MGPPRRGRLHLRRGDRRCSTRSRASAATRASSRRSRPTRASTRARRSSTTSRRWRPCRTSSRWAARSTRKLGTRELDRHEARLGLGQRPAPGQLRDRARHALAGDHLRPRRRPARGPRGQAVVPGRLVLARADRGRPRPRPTTSTRWPRPARCSAPARSSSSTTRSSVVDVALKLAKFYRHESLRQVHAVPRGHELDREDARAHRARRGHADGPRHHGLGPGADHRQLPVRARRRDGDAGRLDDREVPRRVRGAHRGRARAQRAARRRGRRRPEPVLQGAAV